MIIYFHLCKLVSHLYCIHFSRGATFMPKTFLVYYRNWRIRVWAYKLFLNNRRYASGHCSVYSNIVKLIIRVYSCESACQTA